MNSQNLHVIWAHQSEQMESCPHHRPRRLPILTQMFQGMGCPLRHPCDGRQMSGLHCFKGPMRSLWSGHPWRSCVGGRLNVASPPGCYGRVSRRLLFVRLATTHCSRLISLAAHLSLIADKDPLKMENGLYGSILVT